MNTSVPLLPVARLLGGLCACFLLLQVAGRAQQPEPAAASTEATNPENKAGDAANDTEILATEGATFSAKDRVAIFSGNVRVKDPRFVLACDKLTVYIAKGAIPTTMSASSTPAETPTKAADSSPRGGGIDRAVAEGHVIIVQKHAPTKPGEEEKVSVGRADIVEFDNKTGDTILRGMPKVEQNGNSHEALSRSTWMVLHRDNSLETHGPNSTHFTPQRGKDNLPGGSPGGRTSAPQSSASPTGRRTPASGTQN